MKKYILSTSVFLLVASMGCSSMQAKPTTSSAAASQPWVDASLVKQLLSTGLVYPANKASVVGHLDKVGGNLAGLDMSRLKGIPDKTFMSADEVISAAK